MKQIHSLYILLILILALNVSVQSQTIKVIDVGKLHTRILDNGNQGEILGSGGGEGLGRYYFDGGKSTGTLFGGWVNRDNGTQFGIRNWKDTTGAVIPYMIAGAQHGKFEMDIIDNIQFAVPDIVGNTVYKYMRYPPPKIVVDGVLISRPYPFDDMDKVDPSKIPGTADVMIESFPRTPVGLEVHQKVLGWSQGNHDDYVIFDIVLKNTGNVNQSPKIELPTQTLDSLYIMRGNGVQTGTRKKEWTSWVGAREGEDLRLIYTYPARTKTSQTDDFGGTANDSEQPRIFGPIYYGEALLFISNAPNKTNILTDDNPNQPWVNSAADYRVNEVKYNPTDPGERESAYKIISRGIRTKSGYETPLMQDDANGRVKPGYHEVPVDQRGFKFYEDIPLWGNGYHAYVTYTVGPFNIAPGDSIRLVYALVAGSISKRKAYEVGRAYFGKNEQYTPPPGCVWNDATGAPEMDNLPPQYKLYPDLISDPTYGNKVAWIKDCWVATGKDSLFNNARAAQWNLRQSYNIPVPPPPPSIEVQGRSNAIRIKWDNISESASDFAGYRVYRAIGSYADSAWVKIFETTKSNLVHQFDDISAVRGTGYYYYVTAFNDGSKTDFDGKKYVLESGMFANMTTVPAKLSRASSDDLDQIRVVPNPFSLQAAANNLQFPGEDNKIMFYNLPPDCIIRIFTESGDLVRTIEHTSGSGDKSWGLASIKNDHQSTAFGQRPVSGLYVANITTPDGRVKNVKFLIIR